MDTENKNPENEMRKDQLKETIEIRVEENIGVQEGETKFQKIKSSLLVVISSAIVGIITSILLNVFSGLVENRIIIPDEYFSLIIAVVSVLVSICTMSLFIFFLYKKQRRERSLILTQIREKEKNLLNDIDKGISAILK
jgi:hypothetical protein